MKRFLASYGMNGKQWAFMIAADSFEDAERRLAAIKAWGKIDGEFMFAVPAVAGSWLPNLVIRLANLFRGAA